MKRLLFAVAVGAAVAAQAVEFEATVADASRAVTTAVGDRMWQTATTLEDPLVWYWPESATEARLTVVDLLRNRSQTEVIVREAGAVTGSYLIPGLAEVSAGAERLFDLSITFLAGENELRTDMARVAYLPSADSAATQVLRGDAVAWGKVVGGRVASYDADWKTETVGLTPVIYSCRTEVELPAPSGYFAIRARDVGTDVAQASLSFGAVEDAWTASLTGMLPGLLLMLR